jgi:hypothetical protein
LKPRADQQNRWLHQATSSGRSCHATATERSSRAAISEWQSKLVHHQPLQQRIALFASAIDQYAAAGCQHEEVKHDLALGREQPAVGGIAGLQAFDVSGDEILQKRKRALPLISIMARSSSLARLAAMSVPGTV